MLQPPRRAPPCATERKLAQPRAAFLHPLKACRTVLRMLAPPLAAILLLTPQPGKVAPAQGSTRQQQAEPARQNSIFFTSKCFQKQVVQTKSLNIGQKPCKKDKKISACFFFV